MPQIDQHDLDARRVSAAQNQSFFREVNRRIEEISLRWSTPAEFVCECLDPHCVQTVALTAEEYREVRSDPNSFFVLAGHELDDIEETSRRTDRYLVVHKRGVGAEVAVSNARLLLVD